MKTYNDSIEFGAEYALLDAAEAGDCRRIEELLEEGADIEYNNGSALNTAARYNQSDAVKLLIKKGAKIDSYEGGEAVCYAAKYNDIDLVKFLVKNGADISKDYYQAQRWAESEGNWETHNFLNRLAYLKRVREGAKYLVK